MLMAIVVIANSIECNTGFRIILVVVEYCFKLLQIETCTMITKNKQSKNSSSAKLTTIIGNAYVAIINGVMPLTLDCVKIKSKKHLLAQNSLSYLQLTCSIVGYYIECSILNNMFCILLADLIYSIVQAI